MILKPITNGKVFGTGVIQLDNRIFGGALITTNGLDAAVIIVRDIAGSIIFDLSSSTPGFIAAPIPRTET